MVNINGLTETQVSEIEAAQDRIELINNGVRGPEERALVAHLSDRIARIRAEGKAAKRIA